MQSQSLLRSSAMTALGRLTREDFPQRFMTDWITLLKAIAEQDRDDLALAARTHLKEFAPHLPKEIVIVKAPTATWLTHSLHLHGQCSARIVDSQIAN